MAVDPDPLTMARCPVTWPPDVVGAADVITGTAHIVRPVANCDRDRAWITGIVRSARVIRAAAIVGSPVVRPGPCISGVIVGASTEAKRRGNYN